MFRAEETTPLTQTPLPFLIAAAALLLAAGLALWTTALRRRVAKSERERRRTADELNRRLSELFSLQELAYVLSESLQLDRIVEQVVRYAMRFLDARGALLALATEQESETRQLRVAAAEGTLVPLKGQSIRGDDPGLVARSLGRERLELVRDSGDAPTELVSGVQAESAAAVPLRAHGVVVGTLVIADPRGGVFNPEDLRLLSTVANHAAVALANARFFEIVRRAKEQWETAFDALHEGIAVVDEGGRVLRANRSLAQMLDRPVAAVAGEELLPALVGQAAGSAALLDAARRGEQAAALVARSDRLRRTLRLNAARIAGGGAGGTDRAEPPDLRAQGSRRAGTREPQRRGPAHAAADELRPEAQGHPDREEPRVRHAGRGRRPPRVAAGGAESGDQRGARHRRDRGGPPAHDPHQHVVRPARAAAGGGHGSRDLRGRAPAPVHAVLHDEGAGPRDRAGAVHHLLDRRGAWRADHGRAARGGRGGLPRGAATRRARCPAASLGRGGSASSAARRPAYDPARGRRSGRPPHDQSAVRARGAHRGGGPQSGAGPRPRANPHVRPHPRGRPGERAGAALRRGARGSASRPAGPDSRGHRGRAPDDGGGAGPARPALRTQALQPAGPAGRGGTRLGGRGALVGLRRPTERRQAYLAGRRELHAFPEQQRALQRGAVIAPPE